MALGLVLGVATAAPPDGRPAPELPTDSLYWMGMELTQQDGRTVGLDTHIGHPTLVTMFYASCASACPALISDLHRLETALTAKQRRKLRVLLVSFDPERDTPEALRRLAEERRIDTRRWTLASASGPDVRGLAAVLGIAFRRLDGGHYNHSAVITLLDAWGVPTARVEGLGQDLGPLLDAL